MTLQPGTGSCWSIYFEYSRHIKTICTANTGGGAAGWIEVGATSGVETFTNAKQSVPT